MEVAVAVTDADAASRPKPKPKPKGGARRRVKMLQRIPSSIADDPALLEAMKVLPDNYSFEIPKTIWRLKTAGSTRVALQFPEGLLMYSCIISDILERFAGVETLIMGDVTYGACCVDDYSAAALGCDFLVHYGHSCLVPVDPSGPLKMLYVFVEIGIDTKHLVKTIEANFQPEEHLVLAGTIQFTAALRTARRKLSETFASLAVPQAKPLSPGETLGCTAPNLCDSKSTMAGKAPIVIFVADGRFHLESLMIQNPDVKAFYKYDPYSRKLTKEQYDHSKMHQLRQEAISKASKANVFGLILGTLGRQGNPRIVSRIKSRLQEAGKKVIVVLLSEVFPAKLAMMKSVEAWIQVACPRLSIDWGHAFERPLLSSYEAEVVMKLQSWKPVYPMDFYRKDGGPWSNYHTETKIEIKRRATGSRGKQRRPARRKVEISYEEGSNAAKSSAKQ